MASFDGMLRCVGLYERSTGEYSRRLVADESSVLFVVSRSVHSAYIRAVQYVFLSSPSCRSKNCFIRLFHYFSLPPSHLADCGLLSRAPLLLCYHELRSLARLVVCCFALTAVVRSIVARCSQRCWRCGQLVAGMDGLVC